MSDKILRKKWNEARLDKLIQSISWFGKSLSNDSQVEELTGEQVIQMAKDIDPSPNLRFVNLILNNMERSSFFFHSVEKKSHYIKEGLELYLEIEKQKKETNPNIPLKPISKYSNEFNGINRLIEDAHSINDAIFSRRVPNTRLHEILKKYKNRNEMLDEILSLPCSPDDLLSDSYRSHVIAHPKLREVLKSFIKGAELAEKSVFMGGKRPDVLSLAECQELESGRNREGALYNLFHNRFTHGVLLDYPNRPDCKVYIIFGEYSKKTADILITMENENREEVPVANTSGIERYVTPDYRGKGLAVEMVLIPHRIPEIQDILYLHGSGIYSPGGHNSRLKAFHILENERELSCDKECDTNNNTMNKDKADAPKVRPAPHP